MDGRMRGPRGRILAALDEVGSAAPQGRDRAFVVFRRLLAATLAAQRWFAPSRLVRRHRSRRLERLEAAIDTSVTVLEQIPRDSLDFLIEVRLLEELLDSAAGLADDADGWGAVVVAAAQQVLDDLPSDAACTFQQLRSVADARARVIVESRAD